MLNLKSVHMERSRLIAAVVLGLFCCAKGFAADKEKDKLQFGLVSGVQWSQNNSGVNASQAASSMGVFLNYSLSRKLCVELEVRKHHSHENGICTNGGEACLFYALQNRDWSTKLALNYHLGKPQNFLLPYVGIGAGNYYIQDSKTRIKQGQENSQETNFDSELRSYYKRPGVFAAVGMRLQPTSRLQFFVQAKSSVMFDRDHSLEFGEISRFTDIFNISTGMRFHLN